MKGIGFFKAGAIILIITGCLHTFGMVQEPIPENETEKTLLNLMNTYQMELPGGKKLTMMDLYTFFNFNFALFTFLTGVFNLWILKQGVADSVIRKIMLWNALLWALYLIPLYVFTFILPQLFITLATVCFVTALIFNRKLEKPA